MDLKGKKILLCDCERTMALDGEALAKACGGIASEVYTQLCRSQLDNFRSTVATAEVDLLVACTQEAPLFQEVLEEHGGDQAIDFTNIREHAGWSAEGAKAGAKIAALLAEATLAIPPVPTIALASEGVCLVYGRDESAIEAAQQLAGRLDVTVLLSQPEEVLPPRTTEVPIFKGTITAAKGHLGAFELVINDYAPAIVSSRQSLLFEPPKNGATSRCDLILDLSRGAPLFPAHEKRDGYFRPDPGNPATVQRALFELTDMVGEFEKPRYVDFKADLCAHSRSQQVGCTRCLDVCPASAIEPNGDVVAIDPYLCGGCGACNSVCPTGAADYLMPPNATLLTRADILLSTYAKAGGTNPVLLIHDQPHGVELISHLSRHGRGLPANVLPFAVNEVTQLGVDVLAGVLAKGTAQIIILVPPRRGEELTGLNAQVEVVNTIMHGLGFGAERIQIVLEDDPEAMGRRLEALEVREPPEASRYIALGGKRDLMRQALLHLHKVAPKPVDQLALPEGAPYGQVAVTVEGCTLCLACVGACPTGALTDNPEQRPELRFQEAACIQCGLCKSTCPEKVIQLEPRINFTDQARQNLVIKYEEPFHCVRCGNPFGTKSSIDRIVERLADKHWMYQDGKAVELIKMCQDCRIEAQYEVENNPLAGPERRPTRTTDDYLREREEIDEARARLREERAKASNDDEAEDV